MTVGSASRFVLAEAKTVIRKPGNHTAWEARRANSHQTFNVYASANAAPHIFDNCVGCGVYRMYSNVFGSIAWRAGGLTISSEKHAEATHSRRAGT